MADPRDVARRLREQAQAAEAALEDAERRRANLARMAEEVGAPDLAAQVRQDTPDLEQLRRVRDQARELAEGLERSAGLTDASAAAAIAGDEDELGRVMHELLELEQRQVLRVERLVMLGAQALELPAAVVDGFHRWKRRALAALRRGREGGPTS